MAIGKDDSAALAGQTVSGWPMMTHPLTPEGVWAVIDRDMGESITMVFPTEIEALRILSGRGYGRVGFVPFGKDLHDIDTEETRLAQLRAQLSSAVDGGDTHA